MQKGDGVGGGGEFSGQSLQLVIRMRNNRAIVIHGSLPPMLHVSSASLDLLVVRHVVLPLSEFLADLGVNEDR
jgi:hypothetical protein